MSGRLAMLLVCMPLTACAPTAPIEDAASDERTGFDVRSTDATESSTPSDGRDVPARDVQFAPFDAVPSDIVGAFEACNTLRTTALPIEETRVRGDVPAAIGGTIVNGWYVLTRSVIYTTGLEDAGEIDVGIDAAIAPDVPMVDGNTAESGRTDSSFFSDITFGRNGRQEAMQVSESSVYRISRRGMDRAVTANFRLTTSGAAATTMVFCPPGETLAIDGFDATPTRIVLYSSSERRVDTYDRQ